MISASYPLFVFWIITSLFNGLTEVLYRILSTKGRYKVFVSNLDLEYEKKFGRQRYHKSFFGEVTELLTKKGIAYATVKFPGTPNGVEQEWVYTESELSLASDLDNMTLKEVKEKYGVDIFAEL